MASGHVNRTNRPNTWLHRPATRREDSPCQLGAVHTWHIAFESVEKARAWYDSPAYQELVAVRKKASTATLFIAEGVSN